MEKTVVAERLKPQQTAVKASGRNPSMDVLRIFAFMMIVTTHFFLQSGFYQRNLVGPRLFVMTLIRCFSVICVPTFILLTGFLMKNKTWSPKYYSGLKKTLVTYFLASIPCYLYWVYAFGRPLNIKVFIADVLNFQAAKYSWYIEMYIGLFLLIPFLNVLWNNLPSKKLKLILIATLVLMTSLPAVVNVYDLSTDGWWATPMISKSYNPIIPDWWTGIYPLTYYFIGCYLREHPVKIKKWLNLVMIAVSGLALGGYSFWRSSPGKFISGSWQSHGSILNLALTVSIFIFFANLDLTAWSDRVKKICTRLSELCLGAYLLSNIPDKYFYAILNERVADIAERFNWFIVIVPVCIVSSFILSYVVNLASKGALKLWDMADETTLKLLKKSDE